MSESLEEKQYKRMTGAPIKRLVLQLAAPTIVSMLVTSVYNMADTYFVSQLGKSASGAVGVVFSLMAIIQAVGFTLGMGAGSVISRALGVRDREKANRFACASFFTSLAVGLLITLFGTLFMDRLMNVLGATATVMPYARSYATYILFGAPIMAGSFVLNNILRVEGKAKFSMIGLSVGGVLNIALDPLFIYAFDMGIAGAAVATLISQCVSFAILLGCFLLKKSILNISPRHISRKLSDYAEIIKTGLPSLCRQGFASAAAVLLNRRAGIYGGDAALSGMSIVSKIFMMVFCIGLGIGQGYQPVAGYNYSAGKWGRVREAFRFTLVVGTVIMTVFGVAAFVLAPYIIPWFINDAEVIEIGIAALRFQAVTMPLLSINVMCNMTFQSIGKKVRAAMLSCCRQGLFFIPCVLILPRIFGLTGVEMTQAASDLMTCLISIPFAVQFYRSVKRPDKAMNGLQKDEAD